MGKRSSFPPRDNDKNFWATPKAAIPALVPYLPETFTYWEPCAGDGALIDALSGIGKCVACSDVAPRGFEGWMQQADALSVDSRAVDLVDPDLIITNPPWERKLLHPLIEHLSDLRPTWLLFDADWAYTKQRAPYMPRLRKIVPVGRLKWIPGSRYSGKDNCAWYLFDKPSDQPTEFDGRAS